MNDNKSKFPIGELPQSASPSSLTVDEIAEKKRNQKKSLIKMGAMGVLTLILLIFSSLSWFTMNTQVESSGMNITTATLPFDIATKGASVRNQSVINSKHSEYVEGESGTYYVGDSLLLRFDPTQADNPATDSVNESYLPDIAPGSNGELSLYVIPKTDDSLDVKISLNVIAFAEIDKYKVATEIVEENGEEVSKEVLVKEGTQIIEIKDANDFQTKAEEVHNSEAAAAKNDYVNAANYLKGHILFFGTEGDILNTNEKLRYYYSDPYTTITADSQITFDFPVPANKKGKAVQVPIYWMWTNTLGQIALPNNNSEQRSGYPILADTDTDNKPKITTYLKSRNGSVFAPVDGNTVTNEDIDKVVASTFDSNAFSKLSKGYNKADNEIGTHIRYFMIEVTVESTN